MAQLATASFSNFITNQDQDITVTETLAKPLATNQTGWRINLRLMNKVLLGLIITAFVAHLASANDLAVKGFALRDLKKEAEQLHQENINLEIASTTLGAYSQLSQKVAELNLVKAQEINYIHSQDNLVAKR